MLKIHYDNKLYDTMIYVDFENFNHKFNYDEDYLEEDMRLLFDYCKEFNQKSGQVSFRDVESLVDEGFLDIILGE